MMDLVSAREACSGSGAERSVWCETERRRLLLCGLFALSEWAEIYRIGAGELFTESIS